MDSDTRAHFRDRLYAAYASTHAGDADRRAAVPVFRHDILPHLPRDKSSRVVDIGCGQGELVAWLRSEGFANATGIDVSPEQVALAHRRGIESVRLGDFREILDADSVDALVATDFFEHFDKFEVMEALEACHQALKSDGRLIFRVPNAVSPFGGNFRHGDLTHETSFTARSVRQILAATGFEAPEVYACAPVVHGLKSAARFVAWKGASGVFKTILAAETGRVRGHFVSQNILVVAHPR